MFQLHDLVTTDQVKAYLQANPEWATRVERKLQQYYANNQAAFMDTDFYKITMGQLIWKHFRNVCVEYRLTVRDKSVVFPTGFAQRLQERFTYLAQNHHSLTSEQVEWLKQIPYIDDRYADHLGDWTQPKIDIRHVNITQNPEGQLEVIFAGPWHMDTWWEIFGMKEISALYFEMTGRHAEGFEWQMRAADKISRLKAGLANAAEMGLRRRHSFEVQLKVLLAQIAVGGLKEPNRAGGLIGTSNLFLAWALEIPFIGTMAHELFMVLGSLIGYDQANRVILTLWEYEYGHQLGYYLPDTYGSAAFFAELPRSIGSHFTGPRQDSGDPIAFTDLTIRRYIELGFTPKQIAQKTIVYSDSLNVEKALEILAYAQNPNKPGLEGYVIGAAFGIGTNFSNDVGHKHLNMVVKPYRVWLEQDPETTYGCVKISDDPGKITGEPKAVEMVKHWLETGEVLWQAPWAFDYETFRFYPVC